MLTLYMQRQQQQQQDPILSADNQNELREQFLDWIDDIPDLENSSGYQLDINDIDYMIEQMVNDDEYRFYLCSSEWGDDVVEVFVEHE